MGSFIYASHNVVQAYCGHAIGFFPVLQERGTDVVLHFGMHGTVEWLPGAALGNNGLSW